MTPEELDELEKLCTEANPGLWWVSRQQRSPYRLEIRSEFSSGLEKSARFIATARTALPALLAEVRRLRNFIDLTGCESMYAEWVARCGDER